MGSPGGARLNLSSPPIRTVFVRIEGGIASYWRLRGQIRSTFGEHAEAMADIDHALVLDPRNAMAYYARGTLKLQLHEPADAAADLRRAIDLGGLDDHVLYCARNNLTVAQRAMGYGY